MFDFFAVLSTFNKNAILEAWETDGEYINGTWVETAGEVRSINAVVLQSSFKLVDMIPTGTLSKVPLGLHTYDTLYFSDLDAAGIQSKQTYVRFDGYVYKVIGTGQFSGNVVSNQYSIERYYNNDN